MENGGPTQARAVLLGNGCTCLVRAGLRPAPTVVAYREGDATLETSEVSTDLGGLVGVHPPPSLLRQGQDVSFDKLRMYPLRLRSGCILRQAQDVSPSPSLRACLPSREESQYRQDRASEGSSAGLPPPRGGRIEEGVVPPRAGPKSSATGGETGPGAGFQHSHEPCPATPRRRRGRVFSLCFPDIDGQPALCYNTCGGCRV